ncbi:styrene monooxygenase NADH-dependent flavin reductase subunit StyB [Methylibium petroleiphilum]|uniref:styrene monooxygenase NADH-dependent flavin reductase subunit StyB n=1 Tax=Methylibium petroleiphilum TaxID=105560 RepID=UPI003D287F7A
MSVIKKIDPEFGFAANPLEFRRAVSLFATGIAVVSCDGYDGEICGMTVNSFTSISLEPPTVVVSLKAGKTHRVISRRGGYGVSVLTQEQESYSKHFSGRPQEALAPEFVVRENIPTLKNSLAWFECVTVNCIQIHDHTLFVGRVAACGSSEGHPLMFFASKSHQSALSLAP